MHRFNPNYKQTRLNIPIIDRINQKKKEKKKTIKPVIVTSGNLSIEKHHKS